MTNLCMLAGLMDYIPYPWLQVPAFLIVVGLIIFLVMWRRRQM